MASSPKTLMGAPTAAASQPALQGNDARLRLDKILELLVADGHASATDAATLERARPTRIMHPLELIAAQ
jgi:hypothetical protein